MRAETILIIFALIFILVSNMPQIHINSKAINIVENANDIKYTKER